MIMRKICKSSVEDLAIQRLEGQGYTYLYSPEIAPDSETQMRASFEDVLLFEKVKAAIDRLNPAIPHAACTVALKQVQRFHSPELFTNNKQIRTLKTLRDALLPKLMSEEVQVRYCEKGTINE